MSKKQSYTCSECGAAFLRYPSLVSNPDRPYCSRACVGKSKQHGSVQYCDLCDAQFYRRFGEQDIGAKVNNFCSRACYTEWRAINRKPGTYPKKGHVHLHRQIAEQYLGRPLRPGEVVHHIDLNKHNSNPSNLAVLPSQSFHAKVHFGEVSDAELRRFSLIQAGIN